MHLKFLTEERERNIIYQSSTLVYRLPWQRLLFENEKYLFTTKCQNCQMHHTWQVVSFQSSSFIWLNSSIKDILFTFLYSSTLLPLSLSMSYFNPCTQVFLLKITLGTDKLSHNNNTRDERITTTRRRQGRGQNRLEQAWRRTQFQQRPQGMCW